MSSFPLKLLIADAFGATLQQALEAQGIPYETCLDPDQLTAVIARRHFDLILFDARLLAASTDLLADVRSAQPDALVLLAAQSADLPRVIQAAGDRIYSVLEKPYSAEKLVIELHNAARHLQLEREARRLKDRVDAEHKLLGESEVMQHLRRQIAKAAPSDARVLIFGEHGTGKELVAEAIHRQSKRRGPFVKVNCAAIPRELIESELFGHERGAFTGAISRKIGLIEEAEGGTLLLDEIGDMALDMQAKLLRVLQENEFIRVGGTFPIAFNVRIIAATNKDLRKGIKDGTFRRDLFFRINVIPITVPPLRERRDDIVLLADHFLQQACAPRGTRKGFTPEAMRLLQGYAWPGNVRELRNVMERAAIMIEGETISPADLQRIVPDLVASDESVTESGLSLREKLEAYERQLLLDAYRSSKGNISAMARLLKTDRANLHRKLARYKIRQLAKT